MYECPRCGNLTAKCKGRHCRSCAAYEREKYRVRGQGIPIETTGFTDTFTAHQKQTRWWYDIHENIKNMAKTFGTSTTETPSTK